MPRKTIVLLSLSTLCVALFLGALVYRNAKDSQSVEAFKSSASSSPAIEPRQDQTVAGAAPAADLEYEKATAMIDSGMMSDAEPILRKLLDQDPENLKVIHELVTLYHTGIPNYPEAMRLEEKILVQEKSNTHEFERYRALAKLAKAEDKALDFLSELKPADDSIAFIPEMIRGKIFESKQQYPKAIEAYQAALDMPSEAKGTISELLATALIKAKKYREAEPVLMASIEHYDQYNKDHAANPMDRVSAQNAELKLLDVYLNNGQYQKALALVTELLKTDSQNKQLLQAEEMAKMGLRGGK